MTVSIIMPEKKFETQFIKKISLLDHHTPLNTKHHFDKYIIG